MIRPPSVAGHFYPGRKDSLLRQLKASIPNVSVQQKVIGVVSPHAGYTYSGALAGKLFASLAIPPTVIILGVNHHGMGEPYAIDCREGWETPLGVVKIRQELVKLILDSCPDLEASDIPFDGEHSLEVQVPFIQYLSPETQIVPIEIGGFDPVIFGRVGEGIASAVKEWGKEVLLVASSDMNHFEDAKTSKAKDSKVLEAILKLDPVLMLQRIAQHNVSMCGFAPTAIMLAAAKALGATQAELAGYTNSGDVTGDYSSVVAYAAVKIGTATMFSPSRRDGQETCLE